MTSIHLPNAEELLLVAVPFDRFMDDIFSVRNGKLRYLFEEVSGSDGGPIFKEIDLPEGSYEILGSFFPHERRLDFEPDPQDHGKHYYGAEHENQSISVENRSGFITLLLLHLKEQYPLMESPEPRQDDFVEHHVGGAAPVFLAEDYEKAYKQWTDAQSKLLPERFVVLKMIAPPSGREK